MGLLLAVVSLSIINSSKHTELGSLFQLKKDYKIFKFIDYNQDVYSKLPVIFFLIAFNFILCIIFVALTFIFPSWNMLYILIGMSSWIMLTFIFSVVEYIIYKIRYN